MNSYDPARSWLPPPPPPSYEVPPPPPPAQRTRRVATRRFAVATAALLVLAGGLAAMLVAMHGTGPARASAHTARGPDMPLLRREYGAARYTLESEEKTFEAAMQNAADANDFSNVAMFAERYGFALHNFDDTVMKLDYPSGMLQDVHAMVASDAAVAGDLDSFLTLTESAVDAWLVQWRSDVSKAGAAHEIVRADLGLPKATPQAGPDTFPI